VLLDLLWPPKCPKGVPLELAMSLKIFLLFLKIRKKILKGLKPECTPSKDDITMRRMTEEYFHRCVDGCKFKIMLATKMRVVHQPTTPGINNKNYCLLLPIILLSLQ
jgi:hypothetical protein